jgi:hypothetical protein
MKGVDRAHGEEKTMSDEQVHNSTGNIYGVGESKEPADRRREYGEDSDSSHRPANRPGIHERQGL